MESKISANTARTDHFLIEQTTYAPGCLSGKVNVFFHYEMNTWVAVNMTTYEIQPLPAPELAWVVDDDATLAEVTHPNVPNRLISAFDHFSFQLWKRSSDDRLVVRNKLYADEPELELSEFLSTHREATLHVRNLNGDAYHTFTVFLFDALCCGSFAHWSIKGLL